MTPLEGMLSPLSSLLEIPLVGNELQTHLDENDHHLDCPPK